MLSPKTQIKRIVQSAARRFGYHVGALPLETLAEHLRDLFAHSRIDVVLDVGAHYGEYGEFLRNLGYTGTIISFEPIRESFARLEKKAGADGRWRAFNFALGSTAKKLSINVTKETLLTSFLSPSRFGAETFGGSSVARSEEVDIKRLDDVLDECTRGLGSPRIYLKLDTQGYDLEVLRGARAMAPRILALQSEMAVKKVYEQMPDYRESIGELNSMGFEISGMFAVNRARDLSLVEFDCVMINASQQRSR